mgnify:CR=1 FL=1
MQTHRDLDVWKEGVRLTVAGYKITKAYPREEQFGLISQMRRAVVSVVSNIAEGAARNSKEDFIRFLYMSRGSASELETQTVVSRELAYLEQNEVDDLLSRIDSRAPLKTALIVIARSPFDYAQGKLCDEAISL